MRSGGISSTSRNTNSAPPAETNPQIIPATDGLTSRPRHVEGISPLCRSWSRRGIATVRDAATHWSEEGKAWNEHTRKQDDKDKYEGNGYDPNQPTLRKDAGGKHDQDDDEKKK
jgi:hypothetical protein